ncbi:hypothetical protein VU11_05860 [Desulfobulbus sp. US2]|nr:hypothetical protein [Desulfobulbus sp. US4]MCW5208167.1 hypothetical protein [Desulfobulbus sp. US2]WLE95976.1 MAG: hypothetical protein QTN59_14980 [Candidatus Electrothrix communis]
MNNKATKQDSINELKSKIYYAETTHAALYESNSIYIGILKQELNSLENPAPPDGVFSPEETTGW